MKHILLISPYWQEEHRWMVSSVKLAELWQRIGYKVTVLCMGHGVEHEKVSETLEIHRLKDIFLKDPWNYGIALGFSGKALTLTRTLRPDIIVVNKVLFWSSFALLRLRLAGYSCVLITDALVGITWWPRNFLAKCCACIYARTLGWIILLAARKIVLFHPQPSNVLHSLGIEKKCTVIPTGIDVSLFPEKNFPQTSARVNVTYIGRLESVKGVDDFVAAALKAKEECGELHARVVGWYPERHPLVCAHASSIEFTGLRKDIAEVLRTTDIFVLPSYSEGLSNALMEAMSSGCSCIASDVGGSAYLIENGVSGFLFPAGDRDALSAHIARLARDPEKRASLGRAARVRIEKTFSWDVVGKSYTHFFQSLVA